MYKPQFKTGSPSSLSLVYLLCAVVSSSCFRLVHHLEECYSFPPPTLSTIRVHTSQMFQQTPPVWKEGGSRPCPSSSAAQTFHQIFGQGSQSPASKYVEQKAAAQNPHSHLMAVLCQPLRCTQSHWHTNPSKTKSHSPFRNTRRLKATGHASEPTEPTPRQLSPPPKQTSKYSATTWGTLVKRALSPLCPSLLPSEQGIPLKNLPGVQSSCRAKAWQCHSDAPFLLGDGIRMDCTGLTPSGSPARVICQSPHGFSHTRLQRCWLNLGFWPRDLKWTGVLEQTPPAPQS